MVVKIGLLGYGFMGKTHAASVIVNPAAELVSVYSQPEDKAAIEKLGCTFHGDWKNLIDEGDIDAVIIATPTFTHRDIAIKAMESGLHVFLEKPMERTLAKAIEINEKSKEKGVCLAMGHVLRFDSQHVTIKKQVEAGAVGIPRIVRSTRGGPPPGWSTWFFDEKLSGTVILDLAIHDIDYACWLAGSRPVKTCAVASPIELGGTVVLGTCHVVLEFAPSADGNGRGIELAFVEASWGANPIFPFTTLVEVAGTSGLLTCSQPGRHSLETFTAAGRVASSDHPSSAYQREIDDFIHAIQSGSPPAVSGDAGVDAVSVCLASLESAKTGKAVVIGEVVP